MKIGVMAESFRLPFEQAVRAARELGADGLQLYAVAGELDARAVTPQKTREVRRLIEENGLEVSAVCGDFGGHGFAVAADNPARIEASRRVLEFALELGSRVVTTHIGVVPADPSAERYAVMREACARLAGYAAQCGAVFAVETGPEPAAVLAAFLDAVGSPGIGANLDPANLVMVTGDDPAQAVRALRGHIVHTHAKDGVMKQKTDPQIIYDFFAEGGIGDLRLGDYFEERPLGQGAVDFGSYLAALRGIGYDGYLTVEREVGETPAEDIRLAVEFLKARR